MGKRLSNLSIYSSLAVQTNFNTSLAERKNFKGYQLNGNERFS